MDTFEFAQIPIAIILGFGISEILAGWGHQIQHRSERHFSALHLTASAYVLWLALRYLWIQWTVRPDSWDYAFYLLTVAPAATIALASHTLRFDPHLDDRDPSAQYERNRGPLCILLAIVAPLQALRLVYFALSSGYSAPPADSFQSSLLVVGFLTTTLACCWMATTAKPGHQWTGWGILWCVQVAYTIALVPTLVPSTG